MKVSARQTKLDIVAVSGILTATIHPNPHWLWMALEAILIVFFSRYTFRDWQGLSIVTRALFLWGDIAGIIAWFYQLSGSEIIEFDARQLRIRKDIFGWDRVREYKIEECSSLEVHEQGEGDHFGLQCKAGWKTLRFGEHLSEEQAIEILTALQRELPEVAQRLSSSTEDKKNFVTLDLSSQ
jgi:hypothetical protein